MPEARIKNLPKEIDKEVRVYQVRNGFKEKGDAIVDILRRFFATEDAEYFEKTNSKKPKKKIEDLMNPKEKGK